MTVRGGGMERDREREKGWDSSEDGNLLLTVTK